MQPLVKEHVLVDGAGPGWVSTTATAERVWLSAAREDLLLQASREGSRVAIVTGPGARLTEPLRDTLTTIGGKWVIRDRTLGLWDGLSGATLESVGQAFEQASSRHVNAGFLTPAEMGQLQLVVSWSMRLKAEAETVLAGSVESFLHGMGLGDPWGWGLHEPVTEQWSRQTITKLARSRMPGPVRLIVAGGVGDLRTVLTLMVQRTSHGLEEIVTGLVGVGSVTDAEATRRLLSVTDVLADMCLSTMPLFALVMSRAGSMDLAQEPRLTGAPMPVAMLIGPPGVRELGIDVDDAASRWAAVAAGRSRLPALIYPLLPHESSDATKLYDILRGLDQNRLRAVFGRAAASLPDRGV